jgi:hypothetical protein
MIGIATCYGWQGSDFEPRCGVRDFIFFTHVQRVRGAYAASGRKGPETLSHE